MSMTASYNGISIDEAKLIFLDLSKRHDFIEPDLCYLYWIQLIENNKIIGKSETRKSIQTIKTSAEKLLNALNGAPDSVQIGYRVILGNPPKESLPINPDAQRLESGKEIHKNLILALERLCQASPLPNKKPPDNEKIFLQKIASMYKKNTGKSGYRTENSSKSTDSTGGASGPVIDALSDVISSLSLRFRSNETLLHWIKETYNKQ